MNSDSRWISPTDADITINPLQTVRKIQTKYSQTFLYIILLACILGLMLFARRCDSGLHLPQLMTGGSKGDTIDVGLIYGPMSYYIYDDTLGGMNYELILRMEKEIGGR